MSPAPRKRSVSVRALVIPADRQRRCAVHELTLTAASLSDAIGGGLLADRTHLRGDLLIAGTDTAGNDTDLPYAIIVAAHRTGLLPCFCEHD